MVSAQAESGAHDGSARRRVAGAVDAAMGRPCRFRSDSRAAVGGVLGAIPDAKRIRGAIARRGVCDPLLNDQPRSAADGLGLFAGDVDEFLADDCILRLAGQEFVGVMRLGSLSAAIGAGFPIGIQAE